MRCKHRVDGAEPLQDVALQGVGRPVQMLVADFALTYIHLCVTFAMFLVEHGGLRLFLVDDVRVCLAEDGLASRTVFVWLVHDDLLALPQILVSRLLQALIDVFDKTSASDAPQRSPTVLTIILVKARLH